MAEWQRPQKAATTTALALRPLFWDSSSVCQQAQGFMLATGTAEGHEGDGAVRCSGRAIGCRARWLPRPKRIITVYTLLHWVDCIKVPLARMPTSGSSSAHGPLSKPHSRALGAAAAERQAA